MLSCLPFIESISSFIIPKLLENSLSFYWLLVSRAESVVMQLAKVGDISDATFTHTTPHTTECQCVETPQTSSLLLALMQQLTPQEGRVWASRSSVARTSTPPTSGTIFGNLLAFLQLFASNIRTSAALSKLLLYGGP
jgi:hypothetical protein